MKVLSLIQPWATLIALGEKKIETRSWNTKHRGPLAIHAGIKIDIKACEHPVFCSILQKHNINELPTGVIIATCNLDDIKRTEELKDTISIQERAFGDYSEFRFGWLLSNVKQITPIAAKGQLKLWEFDIAQK